MDENGGESGGEDVSNELSLTLLRTWPTFFSFLTDVFAASKACYEIIILNFKYFDI